MFLQTQSCLPQNCPRQTQSFCTKIFREFALICKRAAARRNRAAATGIPLLKHISTPILTSPVTRLRRAKKKQDVMTFGHAVLRNQIVFLCGGVIRTPYPNISL